MSILSKISVGVSSCLLGNNVYHNGGHRKNQYITDVLSEFFEFTPICPEMAIGLGAPRPAIHLTGNFDNPEVVVIQEPTKKLTSELKQVADDNAQKLMHISAYIFKSQSPSCGVNSTKVYLDNGMPNPKRRSGVYAERIMQLYPLLPVEEEGRLNDAALRDNFLERVFTYHRWQQLCSNELSMKALYDFHVCHKFILMSRSGDELYELGRLLANHDNNSITKVANQYIEKLMVLLKGQTSRKKHTNVLQHIMGFLKKDIDAKQKAEMTELITKYQQGLVPLIAPLTLLKHYFQQYPNPYINQQYYLEPYPEKLMAINYNQSQR